MGTGSKFWIKLGAIGLFASLEFDTPSGPSIVVAALVIFLISVGVAGTRRKPDGDAV